MPLALCSSDHFAQLGLQLPVTIDLYTHTHHMQPIILIHTHKYIICTTCTYHIHMPHVHISIYVYPSYTYMYTHLCKYNMHNTCMCLHRMYIQNMFRQHITYTTGILHTQVTYHVPNILAHTAFTMTSIPSLSVASSGPAQPKTVSRNSVLWSL